MSRSSRPEDEPDRWPLLQLLGTRTVLISGGHAFEEPGTPPFPSDLIQLAEAEELLAARAGGPSTRIWPKPPPLSLWSRAAAMAESAGGLRIHDPFSLGIQAQAYCQPEHPVPILYLDEATVNVVGPSAPTVTVWYNPHGGPPLPVARQEALEIHALLGPHLPDVRFLARALPVPGAREVLAESDVIVYLGHGEALAGTIGVPCPDGVLPLADALRDPTRQRVLIFGACVERGVGPVSTGGACSLLPCCRLADRPSTLLTDVLASWVVEANLAGALRSAFRSDLARGDFRWRTFRYSGDAHWARRPLAYS